MEKIKVDGLVKIKEGVRSQERSIIATDHSNPLAHLGLILPAIFDIKVSVEKPFNSWCRIVVSQTSLSIPQQDFSADRIRVEIELELIRYEGKYVVVRAILDVGGKLEPTDLWINKMFLSK